MGTCSCTGRLMILNIGLSGFFRLSHFSQSGQDGDPSQCPPRPFCREHGDTCLGKDLVHDAIWYLDPTRPVSVDG